MEASRSPLLPAGSRPGSVCHTSLDVASEQPELLPRCRSPRRSASRTSRQSRRRSRERSRELRHRSPRRSPSRASRQSTRRSRERSREQRHRSPQRSPNRSGRLSRRRSRERSREQRQRALRRRRSPSRISRQSRRRSRERSQESRHNRSRSRSQLQRRSRSGTANRLRPRRSHGRDFIDQQRNSSHRSPGQGHGAGTARLHDLEETSGEQHIPGSTNEVKMSYIEIYNENIRDLLNPGGPLELRDEGSGAPVVAGLSEVEATSAAHVCELLTRGDRARTAEPTHANQHSSRGHALLSVTVSTPVAGGTQRGRLFLIDLAGSERAGLRARRLEGAHINRSLLALGNCIMALSGGARYVNYRDSKLTRLLREVLGGRCRTAMVAHVAPGSAQRETTRSTLHYAQRASSITTRVERELIETPMHMSQYRTVISELREEISRLKSKMKDSSRSKEDLITQQHKEEELTKEQSEENAAHLKSLREAIVSTFKQQMRQRRRLMELDSHLLGLALDAERQHAAISHWEARFNRLYKPISLSGSRLSTQQSYRGGTGSVTSGSERAEAEVAVEQAWAELAAVEREQEAARTERARVERQLEQVRLRGAQLEQELPARISSGPEREVLALVCRVHELEADKLALQGERAARSHELRRRDLALQRRDAQRRLSDEIITRQRRALEEMGIGIPPELSQLYELYQQEIHASTYTESNDVHSPTYRLPPISTSLSELAWSESSSGSGRGSSSGSGGTLALDHRLPRLAPTPRPRTRYSQASAATMKRYSSDDSLVMVAPRAGDAAAP